MDFVSSDFEAGAALNVTTDSFQDAGSYFNQDGCKNNSTCVDEVSHHLESVQSNSSSSTIQRLNKQDCVAAYANVLLTERSNVVVVTSNESTTNNALLVDHSTQLNDTIDIVQARYFPFSW
jgi:dihydropteroate synthase